MVVTVGIDDIKGKLTDIFTCTVKLVERSVLELVCGTPYNYVLRNVGFKRGITV